MMVIFTTTTTTIKPQFLLENSSYKLYYDRSIIPDRTTHSNGPKVAILDKTIKAAHSIDTSIPNRHILHNTITEKLQKFTDLKNL
jgi:hypothetical protein